MCEHEWVGDRRKDMLGGSPKEIMKHVTATLEWHYYCPKCERSCLTRFSGRVERWVNTCSDCGEKYEIRPTPRALDGAERCPNCDKSWDKFFCAECGYCAPPRQ